MLKTEAVLKRFNFSLSLRGYIGNAPKSLNYVCIVQYGFIKSSSENYE